MADTLIVAILLGFIAICIAYTKWCDHIIGPDEAQAAVKPNRESVI